MSSKDNDKHCVGGAEDCGEDDDEKTDNAGRTDDAATRTSTTQTGESEHRKVPGGIFDVGGGTTHAAAGRKMRTPRKQEDSSKTTFLGVHQNKQAHATSRNNKASESDPSSGPSCSAAASASCTAVGTAAAAIDRASSSIDEKRREGCAVAKSGACTERTKSNNGTTSTVDVESGKARSRPETIPADEPPLPGYLTHSTSSQNQIIEEKEQNTTDAADGMPRPETISVQEPPHPAYYQDGSHASEEEKQEIFSADFEDRGEKSASSSTGIGKRAAREMMAPQERNSRSYGRNRADARANVDSAAVPNSPPTSSNVRPGAVAVAGPGAADYGTTQLSRYVSTANGAHDDSAVVTSAFVADRRELNRMPSNAPIIEGPNVAPILPMQETDLFPMCKAVKWFLAFLAIVAVAIVVVLAATAAFDRGEDGSVIYITLSPTASLTVSPTEPLFEQPFATSRSERIRSIADSISGADALTFSSSNAPQIMARDWLLYYDTYSPSPPQTDAELGQRYVLAVLYLALGGEDWVESRGWMGDAGECEGWYGVTCSYGWSDPDSGVQLVSELHLGKNGLAGVLPEEVSYLPLLEVLGLTASYDGDEGHSTGDVSGTIPASIGNLRALKVLNLGFNQISGTLPPSLMELTSLTMLELGGNLLEGTIPTDIDRLANLEQLGIGWLVDSSGGLTGTIPSSIGNLSSLKWLQISYNRLTGTIPSEIGKLTNLENLFLYRNEISGTIPPSIGKLTNVEKMALCCNELSGTIPANFGDLTKIEILKFHDNKLEGTMPEEICALKEEHLLTNLAADCEGPNPEVICPCCDQCFEFK